MYGRRPRCKRNLTISEGFGCSHVSGHGERHLVLRSFVYVTIASNTERGTAMMSGLVMVFVLLQ
jgi:hypothetical protein